MWSDTLLSIERAHLLRLGAWGALSAGLGVLVLLVLALRRARPPLPFHFAVQTALWGAMCLAVAGLRLRALWLRDLDEARMLLRGLWLALGLDVGVFIVGATLATVGWMLGRRLAMVGAGMAIVLQGAALLVLHATTVHLIGAGIP